MKELKKYQIELNKEYLLFLKQQHDRDKQLLSEILACFEEQRKRKLKDLDVLKHNIEVKMRKWGVIE